MSGEDTSTSRNNNDVPYDYGDKKAESGKVPKFNGDAEEFSWWKTNFYSYVMGLDEELWDILEDGVGDLVLDEEEVAIDRKKHTPEQKKLYKKHHKIRGSLVTAIPKAEYMKMSVKSTAKAMFASLCANYEGSKKVREAKALMLVHQYELFKMKDDESIEQMYSRFQTLVSGLLNLKMNHLMEILMKILLKDGYAFQQAWVSGKEEQEVSKQERQLQKLQERRSEGMLQVQEVWTFYCWLPWSSEGEVKGQDKEIKFLLEQGCFTSHLLSFDNNKVLKIINWIC